MNYEDKVKHISSRVWKAYMKELDKPISYRSVQTGLAKEVLRIVAEEVKKAYQEGQKHGAWCENAYHHGAHETAQQREEASPYMTLDKYLLSQSLSPAPEPQK